MKLKFSDFSTYKSHSLDSRIESVVNKARGKVDNMWGWLNKICGLVSNICGTKEPEHKITRQDNTKINLDQPEDLANLSRSHRNLINRVNTIESILSNSTSPASNKSRRNLYLQLQTSKYFDKNGTEHEYKRGEGRSQGEPDTPV